jgi:asparagine synthase (glutamine-hydrolysing)
MCGIAGFSGSFDAGLLDRMSAALAHRGPDDAGVHFLPAAGIGLAHRRLAIIDLSPAGHQPMSAGEGAALISYNGELYNFRELRAELERDGFGFRGHSDTEVVLQLYCRDGEALLGRLNGIFAFAIHDPVRGDLFLARDPLGVKPLYYAETPRGFLFASELKALLEAKEVDRRLDLVSLDCHLHYLWSPSPRTLLAGVRKLEPGCALRVRAGRIERSWRYYDLPYGEPLESWDAAEAAARVREAVAEAVRRQMVADVPVGAFLSGGLDSSAVVAMARRAAGTPIRCFTIGFQDEVARKEGMAADLPHARRVAAHLDVELETVWVGPEMVEELPRMLFHLDEPQSDPAPINALLICRLAREHGMKVLLSGAGGDDLFTGYRRHTALAREGVWSWLPRPARRLLSRGALRLPVRGERRRRLVKAFQYADLEGDERLVSYFYWIPPRLLNGVYRPDVRRELDGFRAAQPLLEALAGLPRGLPELHRMLYLEERFFLVDHNLNYTDKMSMASGVEVRVPLLDVDLVRLAARLPPRLKQRGATGKWIFRKAMEGILPPEVIWRAKAGFGAPLRHWLRGPLRPVVDEVLSEASLARRGLFDPLGVRRLVAHDRAGRVDGAYAVFSLVCVELWCRQFVDPPTPRLCGTLETRA